MQVPTEKSSYIQVLRLATTPSAEEFKQTSTVASLGILLVGFLGFVIFATMSLLPAA